MRHCSCNSTFRAGDGYTGKCLRALQYTLQLDVELHQLLHEYLRLPGNFVLLRGIQLLLLVLLQALFELLLILPAVQRSQLLLPLYLLP